MLRVFKPNEREFTTNGDVVIKAVKAKVRKEDNGDYYLNVETDLKYVDHIVEGNIIVANTPQGDQPFRINNVSKTKNRITAKCPHVFYDTKNFLVVLCNIENKTCEEALTLLNNSTEPTSIFSVGSDVLGQKTYEFKRKSYYEAIQIVLTQWGGHLVRDNFNIGIKKNIGQDYGVTVSYKKNLKEISCEEDWSNVVTKLLPVGKDGIMLNAINPTDSIYVESDIQYNIPYVKTIAFTQENISESSYSSPTAYKQALVDDLGMKATEHINKNNKPQINYSLKANLERITDIGDIVEVIDERLNIDLVTSVIAFEYDCLLDEYAEVEFGNFKNSIAGLISDLTTLMGQRTNATKGERDIMTRSLNESVTDFATATYNKIALNTANGDGTKLSATDGGGILIGTNVRQIIISGRMTIQSANTSGVRYLRIMKNTDQESNVLGEEQKTISNSTTQTLSITSQVVDVNTGDIIYLWYNTPASTDVVVGSAYGGGTSLTVEAL